MQKKRTSIVTALLLLALAAAPAFAGPDYSTMSTDELNEMRGTMRDAPAEEREAFQREWQHRINTMTREERQKYSGPPANAPRDGSGDGYGRGMGGGMGGGGMGGGRR
ncbi:MAG: DUF1104 domain-containing protein [Thermodesulfobacteriota bacterium]